MSFLFTPRFFRLAVVVLTMTGSFSLRAFDAEIIGLTAMRRERPTITGVGIPVAQPEGQESTNAWQVSPDVNPSAYFTWTSDLGTATNYPNTVGVVSTHANGVAYNFHAGGAISPGVPRVDSYDADYFFNTIVVNQQPITGQVINQSYIFDGATSPVDLVFDAYAARYNVLFVSGMNNIPDVPHAPGSAYNGLGVGFLNPTAQSSIGPTSDGRAKPDLVAPSCCSSFSTPQVAGGAVLLLQAAGANDGGPGTASIATNSTVIKALLINGAVKTTNWTNGVTRPLDARYGAGVLNLYNSDRQLRGGRRTASATNNVPAGNPHPPTVNTNNLASLRGWDFSSIQSTLLNDRVAHYYVNLPTNSAGYSATATLVWKKGATTLTNLDLFLYDTRGNTQVLSSISTVDNVEHLFIPNLPSGRYDLQVFKPGGLGQFGSESYALAFDFAPARLTASLAGASLVLSWPASPAGFTLQSSPSLSPVAWQAVTQESVLSNALNTVTLPATAAAQFFRLARF